MLPKTDILFFLLILQTLHLAQSDWSLVWEDQFNGGNLADRWSFDTGCDGEVIKLI